MKRLATVALGLAITIPLCAQRSAGHAGFASRGAGISHSAPAFHSSFAPSTAMRHGIAPVSRTPYASRPAPPMTRFVPPTSRYMTVAPPSRRPEFYQNQHNHTYYNNHHARIRTYPVSVVGFLPPDLLDESFYDNQPFYDDSANAQPLAPQPDYADNSYPEPYPQNDQPYSQPQYPQQQYPQAQYPQPEQAAPVAPQMQYVPGSADTVTLIFKDGRPPEQIQNYLATNKTLTVISGSRHREIPIADLDVPATIKANRETGVGFQLPNSTTR